MKERKIGSFVVWRSWPLILMSVFISLRALAVAPGVIEVAPPNEADQPFCRFGLVVKGFSDLTGDGIGELAVSTTETIEVASGAGSVYILNGRDFSVVRRLVAPQPIADSGFGFLLAEAPDMDGDKVAEIIVTTSVQAGNKIYIYSGASGQLLKTVASPDYVAAVTTLPTSRANSAPTIAVGTPYISGGQGARIRIFNLITGASLFTIQKPDTKRWFGVNLATIGDVDGDERQDLAVGAGGAASVRETPTAGGAYIVSGETGKVLHELIVPQPANITSSWAVAAVPDVNGDGKMDVLAGIGGGERAGAHKQAGHAYLFSGADGKLLRSLVSPSETEGGGFGWSVAGVPDVTGDGAGELLVGAASNPFNFGGDPFTLQSWGERKMYLINGATGQPIQSFVSPYAGELNGGAGEMTAVLLGRSGRLRNLIAGVPRENDRHGRVFAFPIRLLTAVRSDEGVRVSLIATDEKDYELHSSSDLKNWSALTAMKGAGEPVTFIDRKSKELAHRFYRAEQRNTPP